MSSSYCYKSYSYPCRESVLSSIAIHAVRMLQHVHTTLQVGQSCWDHKSDFFVKKKCQSTSPVHKFSPLVQSSDCRRPLHQCSQGLVHSQSISQCRGSRISKYRPFKTASIDCGRSFLLMAYLIKVICCGDNIPPKYQSIFFKNLTLSSCDSYTSQH